MSDTDLDALLAALAAHLQSTEELAVSPTASVWLGEAHAVAEDLTAEGVAHDVIRERIGHVRHLLEEAGETGNDEADSAVEAALGVVDEAEAVLDRSD